MEGRVDHWSVRHGVEVGGGSTRRDDARRETAALVQAQGGKRVSPQVGRLGTQATQAD
jgi:hypothetical protein